MERPGGFWPPCVAWLAVGAVLAVLAIVATVGLLAVRW
jgi:hypothetical protein